MPKTNFTKVEEVLEQGLRKYSIDYLLEEADAVTASQPKTRNPTIAYAPESSKPAAAPQLTKSQMQLIQALKRDLPRLQKKDPEMFAKLGIVKKDLKKMIANPTTLKPEDWEALKQIKTKFDLFKVELAKELPQQSNEDLVEAERRDHLKRRFNVNKKWLPLT